MVFKNSWYFHFAFNGILMYITHSTVCLGQGKQLSLDLVLENYLADAFTYVFAVSFCLWAFIWLKMSGKSENGPKPSFGKTPFYKENGMVYYVSTLTVFLIFQWIYPNTSTIIYTKFPKILITGFNFLVHLIVGRFILFYRMPVLEMYFYGIEHHPRTHGEELKQLIVRTALMSCQIFLSAFYIIANKKNGFNVPTLVNFIIQSVYIAQIFWRETRFYSTLDMIADSVGFYFCCGIGIIFPALFTFPAINSILTPPTAYHQTSVIIGLFCLTCMILACKADHENQAFQDSSDRKCLIWGKPADYILAEYKNSYGDVETTALLTSGFKGIARHINFTLELIIYCSFYASLGFLHDSWCITLVLFASAIVVLHAIRQERICKNKYGVSWVKYCEKVPYKLIPGLW